MSQSGKPLKGGLADIKRLHQQALERDAKQRQAQRSAQPLPAAARATAAARDAARTEPRQSDATAPALRFHGDEDVQSMLMRSMAGVAPIRQGRNVNTKVHRAGPSDEQLRKRQAAAGVTSLEAAHIPAPAVSDEYIAARLIENGTAYLRAGMAPDTIRRLRRGQWPFRTEIDLHGMRIETAREALLPFLAQSRANGQRGVRVIHGKGHGSPEQQPVLREKVKTWLVQYPAVLAFAQGREADGGAGALLVLLAEPDTP